MYDTIIIGGGAAGMFAAARMGRGALVLEKSPRVLRKVLASGNGRCNYTNMNITGGEYFGEEAGFALAAVSRFGAGEAVSFFRSIGVEPYAGEAGRVYPRSLQAGAVVDALRFAAERGGAEVRVNAGVDRACKGEQGFEVFVGGEVIRSRRLAVTAGGAAGGGARDGYALLEGFGHSTTALWPILTRLRTRGAFARGLKGIRVPAVLTGYVGGAAIGAASGDVLFAEDGVSGDAAFSLSSLYYGQGGFEVGIDFAPEYTVGELIALLGERAGRLADVPVEMFLGGFVNKRVGMALLKAAGRERLTGVAGELTEGELRKLASVMKDTRLSVIGAAGFRDAQVTRGGARTREFDPVTMESRLVPGLYAAGEVLDVAGPCGGYNLHWAWASAYALTNF